jgi:prolyl-tRNA synthetase
MKLSILFTKTRKDAPADEAAVNAKLLIQAGFIHKEMAGVYTYLPLGKLVLDNIEKIVREEMNEISQEVFMPSLSSVEIWRTTGRIDYVDVLMKATPANDNSASRHNAEYILNFSNEEIITPIAKEYAQSYKDLPLALYQIAPKYRNEARSKSGLLRGREFRMKDLYSFHASAEDLYEYYEQSKVAYMNVFRRVGLGDSTVIAAASGGDFTDDYSHEFQTRLEAGEDTIFRVPSTGEAFNEEVAPSKAPAFTSDEALRPLEEIEGKGLIGVEPLAEFLKIDVEKTTKTMLYVTDDGKMIAAAVRGRYQINEEKLAKVVGAKRVALADEAMVKKITGAEVGYAGLLGLPSDVRVVVDESCANRANFEMGANHTDYHSINMNWGRDLPEPEEYVDIKIAQQGDLHPGTDEVYEVFSASEVGNIFPLHTKFSKAFGYTFTDEAGEEKPVIMGCYGIGTSRLMGVIVEKYHDDRGIVWPDAIAPAVVYIARLGEDADVTKTADELYNALTSQGVLVLYDDRDLRAGEKFADADLMGIPYRVVVSNKTTAAGKVEVKSRRSGAVKLLSADELLQHIQSGDLAAHLDQADPAESTSEEGR